MIDPTVILKGPFAVDVITVSQEYACVDLTVLHSIITLQFLWCSGACSRFRTSTCNMCGNIWCHIFITSAKEDM